MRVCVPRESAPGERRVALDPRRRRRRLRASGFDVVVERGAGVSAGFTDDAVRGRRDRARRPRAAARRSRRDRPGRRSPPARTLESLRVGNRPDRLPRAADRRRGDRAAARARGRRRSRWSRSRGSRARSRWTRSRRRRRSPATRPCCWRPTACPKLFPMLMTAAGTIAPARVLVLGAGVAGLQAIATARRLGAVVSAFDVRPAVAEQVESLGASVPRPRRPRRGDGGRLRAGADRRAAARAAGGARGAHVGVRRRDHDRRGAGTPGPEAHPRRARSSRCAPAR